MPSLDSKINIIHSTYILKLGLIIQKINVKDQKINKSSIEIFKIVIASFFF